MELTLMEHFYSARVSLIRDTLTIVRDSYQIDSLKLPATINVLSRALGGSTKQVQLNI